MLADLLQQKLLKKRSVDQLRREENAARRGLARQIVLLDKRRQRIVRLFTKTKFCKAILDLLEIL